MSQNLQNKQNLFITSEARQLAASIGKQLRADIVVIL